jgi:hypothetical protein
MNTATKLVKPPVCELCEGTENWADTPHAFCDDCMNDMVACIRQDPNGMEVGFYKNAYNYYKES